jgi:competence protein ComEC
VLAALILTLSFFYRPAPSQRDIFHSIFLEEVTLVGSVESFAVSKKETQNVVLKVLSVNGEEGHGYVYARLKNINTQWKDKLEVTGKLQQPYGVDLLGNFDWRRYLANKNIFTEIKTSQTRLIQTAPWYWRGIRNLREQILQAFQKSLPPDLAAIASGILLGEKTTLSSSLYSAFQDSGAIHLLVASGGNVGFVTLITLGLCGLVGLSRRRGLFISLIVAAIYTCMAGADAPLVRAYVMTLCACIGYLLGRNSGVLQGLFISCFAILCWNPSALFETGFQMSFLATFSIVLCLNNYVPPVAWPRTGKFFFRVFLASLASQLALIPIFTNVFYKVSLTGLLSNMVLVPLSSVIMSISFLYALFSFIGVGFLLYWPCFGFLELFKITTLFFGSFKFSVLSACAWGGSTIIIYYLCLFWGLNVPVKGFVRRLTIPLALCILMVWLFQCFYSPKMRIYLLNEWHKPAVILSTHDGAFLFGGTDILPDKINRSLRKAGFEKAEALFLFSEEKGKYPFASYAAKQVIIPFHNGYWPNDTLSFGKTQVKITWGEHQSKEGRLWKNEGYSGNGKNDVSYCISFSAEEVCIGFKGYFIRGERGVFSGKLNQTIFIEK